MFNIYKEISLENFMNPAGYKGLYGFHKYWGKKPAETIAYLIEQLSEVGDVVTDPFLGFGAIAREAAVRKCRFLGCDLNPVSIELTKLLVDPPARNHVEKCFKLVEARVKKEIDTSYILETGKTATHYLWDGSELQQVWTRKNGKRLRIELSPTDHDLALCEEFSGYQPHNLRPLRMFQNSRINSKQGMEWKDLFYWPRIAEFRTFTGSNFKS